MQLSNGTATSAMSLASYKLLLPCMVARAMDDADAALFPAPVQVSEAASRQLVVPHCWATRLGVWCKWSGLSTAGGTPPLGYPAGRVV
jgi:hypothetical protein